MSSRGEGLSVEGEVRRIREATEAALQRGDIGIDEFDAIHQLVDRTHHEFNRGSLGRRKALEALHYAEGQLQGAL